MRHDFRQQPIQLGGQGGRGCLARSPFGPDNNVVTCRYAAKSGRHERSETPFGPVPHDGVPDGSRDDEAHSWHRARPGDDVIGMNDEEVGSSATTAR